MNIATTILNVITLNTQIINRNIERLGQWENRNVDRNVKLII